MATITVKGRTVSIQLDEIADDHEMLWQARAVLANALAGHGQGDSRVAWCEQCEGEFLARRHARFCSTRCRTSACRARAKL